MDVYLVYNLYIFSLLEKQRANSQIFILLADAWTYAFSFSAILYISGITLCMFLKSLSSLAPFGVVVNMTEEFLVVMISRSSFFISKSIYGITVLKFRLD